MSDADPKCILRLERPIPGVDHLKLVDPRKLAQVQHDIDNAAEQIGAEKVEDYFVSTKYGNAKTRWNDAGDGLRMVRTIKEHMAADAEIFEEAIEVLTALETVFDEADTREIRFCFIGNY